METPETPETPESPETIMKTPEFVPAKLSPREVDVITQMSRGMTNQEIANELKIGRRTVETHVGRAMKKRGVPSRIHLVHLALHEGWTKNIYAA